MRLPETQSGISKVASLDLRVLSPSGSEYKANANLPFLAQSRTYVVYGQQKRPAKK